MQTGWLLVAGAALTILLMVPVTTALERRRLRRVESTFLRGRRAVPGDEFLRRAAAEPEQAEFLLAARRAMAELCGVDVELLHPDDTLRSLLDLQWDSGYMEDIVFAMERQLGVELPLAYPRDDRLPFGEYAKQLQRLWGPPVGGSA